MATDALKSPASRAAATLAAVAASAASLKLESLRLATLMATPPQCDDAAAAQHPFVTLPGCAGWLMLFESWLRHEVPATRSAGERLSVSFNYAWSDRT